MIASIITSLVAALVVGALGTVVTIWVGRRAPRWAAVLGPVTVVLAMGAGLLVGVHLMVVDSRVPALILAVTAPVALVVGIVTSVRTQQQVASATRALAAERHAREAEAGRRALIAGLSHDLRTPLAGIRAMAEALEDSVAPDASAYHRAMVAETERTSAMVDDLLAMASLSSGGRDRVRDVVSLDDALSDLVAHLTPMAAARGVRIEGDVDGAVDVPGDPGLIVRALQNLLVNAINYTRPSTVVTARAGVGEGWAEVSVTDHCGGIPETELAHVFEAGWRGDAARTPGVAVGSGLGLPIVATIAEMHAGTIEVTTVADGCRAVLRLPAR